MTAQAIRDALHSNRPFNVRTSDGKTVHVPHQDFAALSLNGRLFVVMTPDTFQERLDVLQITAIEMPAENPAA
jgi:hypothetical protein